MDTKKVSSDRRNFIKSASAASIATLLVSGVSTAFAHSTKNVEPGNGTTYTYRTENSWGPIIEWHAAADLNLHVDAGTSSPPASLSWRDQQGNSFAISFASDMSSFFGYFQRPHEGPIAYRGTLRA
ncbi:hypothetical protein KDA_65350 [Dictyobacter alpinus]|uniref:OAA-family lectin sugar binding domain-containing protein n=1 Tax=Dictyobacter alpinus TaxID=2014873 RepID=A0A402BI03_9CHLR|nr:hypothetical protein [Dictyobacter alpinus]GCE31051.1 hypothetical protein KDA_65350 [Dictyobacter alpinus]